MNDTDFVIQSAEKHKLAPKELIELYSRLQLVVYGNQQKWGYECSGSSIGGGSIDFSIVMTKGKQIPEKLTNLFFNNIDLDYQVECIKIPNGIYKDNEDAYSFNIKLY